MNKLIEKPHRRAVNTISVFTLFVTLIATVPTYSSDAPNLVGTWSGKDSDGETVTMVFHQDQSVEVFFEGIPPLTSANLVNGNVEWATNHDAVPMTLDVIINTGSRESGRLRMIYRFNEQGELDIRNSRDMKTRPLSFDITQLVYQILLTRE